ncbi:MAG: hypothetical protein ACAH95_01125 [Fimbriimonas sp.]
MKLSGRASLMTIVAVAAILLVVGLFLFSKESLSSVATRFLQALDAGDVATLTKMSYLDKDTEEEMRKKWDFAVNKAGRFYRFRYEITAARQVSPDSAQVSMQFIKDALNPNAFPEKIDLPLVKVGGEWKVDVKAMSRDMYPALPR